MIWMVRSLPAPNLRVPGVRLPILVVLQGAQPGVAQLTALGRDPLAVVGIGAAVELVNQITNCQGVVLVGADHQGFLALVDLSKKDCYPLLFALLVLDDLVEVGFGLELASFDLTFHHYVSGGIDVFIEGGLTCLTRKGVRKPSLLPSFRE